MLPSAFLSVIAVALAQLQPALYGTVRGPDGPLPRALVWVHAVPDGRHPPLPAITDADGRFRVRLPAVGTYSIDVNHSDVLVGTKTVRATEMHPTVVVTVMLQPRGPGNVVALNSKNESIQGVAPDATQRLPPSRSYPPTFVLPLIHFR